MQNLGPSWTFDIEFCVTQDDPKHKPLFRIWQPLCPIVSVDSFESACVYDTSCNIIVTLHTGQWPPYRMTQNQKMQDKLYKMKCKFADQQFHVELNGEIQSIRVAEQVPTGVVSVDSSQVLSFDGFSDDSASVSSDELSERQEDVRKWWNLRPLQITKPKDITAYL